MHRPGVSLSRHAVVVLTALALLFSLALPAAAAVDRDPGTAGPDRFSSTSFIVQLAEDPAASYSGGIPGLEATAPAAGKKLNSTDAKVQKYVAHLAKRHADVAAAVGASGTKFYDYYYTLNGFAATLTKAQVSALRKRADVTSVEADRIAHIDTDNTPTFLGLNSAGGLWSQLGGQGRAGEDVVIGVVDTGIWPEHPSFANTNNSYRGVPAGWTGTCENNGEKWNKNLCNGKIIGAQFYLTGFTKQGIVKDDFKSPRDADGHGSHTASTSGGNANVAASFLGSPLGTISGIAPRARIAAYKVCWNSEAGGCASTDSVAAIDRAVADGVDVINFSISGTESNFLDPVEVAFLMANRAGVFVAASAGNSGPRASTVNHPSPWLTTVAASTQDRSFKGSATLGNGSTYTGVTITGGTSQSPLVDSVAAGSELCIVGALNPSVVSGKIVLCKRGVNARVDKSLAVKQAGGLGMILYNAAPNQSLNTDNHWVPSVHISFADGTAIKAYITANAATATARIGAGTRVMEGGNTMADFSSRGPTLAAAGNLIKPDITAPGVNVLAGNSPAAFLGATGQLFQSISGTSMSSPHIAGIAALLRQAHPTWSPSAIRSAIMTTARQNLTKEDGTTQADPFDFGAGHVVPTTANNPGLVYDLGFNDFRGFLRGQGLCTLCFGTTAASIIPASDLNQASFAISGLAGTQTTTRRVTNVGGAAATYNVSVSAPAGVSVTVTPTSLALAAGETKTYEVRFDTTSGATFNAYTFGSLTWSDGSHSVRSPIAIRPVRLAAPASVSGIGVTGTLEYQVRFGYSGTFTADPRGLIAATKTPATVSDDPTNNFDTDNPNANQGITVHDVVVPADTRYARFSTFNAYTNATPPATHDLDMYVYRVTATGLSLVGSSGGGTADEEVNLTDPPAATYKVYVHGWQTIGGGTASYTLFNWSVGNTSAGNFTVTEPATAVSGTTGTVTINWGTPAALTAGTRYLGFVQYGDGTLEIGRTVVNVRTD
jgi:subtilisin family serine protease